MAGCKDGLVEPERFGAITGQVLDFSNRTTPIAGASVTTSPATDAIVTDDEGRFRIAEALVGNYTITAVRDGFDPNTVTIAVREGADAQAVVFLSEEEDDDGSTSVDFAAEVLNFTPEVFTAVSGGDSTFVSIEYRAFNRNETAIGRYEIYFRIDTDRGPFYQEVIGTDLGANQQDFGTVRKYLLGATPSAVVIEDTAAEEATPTDGT